MRTAREEAERRMRLGRYDDGVLLTRYERDAFEAGAEWQKEQAVTEAEIGAAIRAVTDQWDEPLDESQDLPQIVNAVLAALMEVRE